MRLELNPKTLRRHGVEVEQVDTHTFDLKLSPDTPKVDLWCLFQVNHDYARELGFSESVIGHIVDDLAESVESAQIKEVLFKL